MRVPALPCVPLLSRAQPQPSALPPAVLSAPHPVEPAPPSHGALLPAARALPPHNATLPSDVPRPPFALPPLEPSSLLLVVRALPLFDAPFPADDPPPPCARLPPALFAPHPDGPAHPSPAELRRPLQVCFLIFPASAGRCPGSRLIADRISASHSSTSSDSSIPRASSASRAVPTPSAPRTEPRPR